MRLLEMKMEFLIFSHDENHALFSFCYTMSNKLEAAFLLVMLPVDDGRSQISIRFGYLRRSFLPVQCSIQNKGAI
jgi:hypothetical protein